MLREKISSKTCFFNVNTLRSRLASQQVVYRESQTPQPPLLPLASPSPFRAAHRCAPRPRWPAKCARYPISSSSSSDCHPVRVLPPPSLTSRKHEDLFSGCGSRLVRACKCRLMNTSATQRPRSTRSTSCSSVSSRPTSLSPVHPSLLGTLRYCCRSLRICFRCARIPAPNRTIYQQ